MIRGEILLSNSLTYLEIEEVIKEQTDFLIGLVERIEDNLKGILGNRISNENFGNSQIRNLLQAAKSASGVKEIKLFIQYQMGRETKPNDYKWRRSTNGITLGDAVIDCLDKIEKKVAEIFDPETKNYRVLLIRMMERFFLYMSWKYRYLAVQSEGSQKNQSRPKAKNRR